MLLGNFKWKLGVRRERQPFVFTPEMAYVVSEDTSPSSLAYAEFEGICCRAFCELRKKGSIYIIVCNFKFNCNFYIVDIGNYLISLFALMLPAGMPELLKREDISYLRDILSLYLSDSEANEKLRMELKNCLGSLSRPIDNWFHNVMHK